jgi:hypothetical protein
MNVFDFAMKMEVAGKNYYEKLTQKTTLEGQKTIFTRLAADEQKHHETFQQLKTSGTALAMQDTIILGEAKKIFPLRFLTSGMDQARYFRHSLIFHHQFRFITTFQTPKSAWIPRRAFLESQGLWEKAYPEHLPIGVEFGTTLRTTIPLT